MTRSKLKSLHLLLESRILFGASNPSRLHRTSYTPITPLATQKKIISDRIATDPSLAILFDPIYECYYDGPMGGYGANLKTRHVGYGVSSIEGIRRVLKLKHLEVTLIDTPAAFQTFIEETPYFTQAIALVAIGPVIMGHDFDSDHCFSREVHAVMYEKRPQLDALYVYTSGINELDFNQVKSYFRSPFHLLTPDSVRITSNLSGLYAIEDAAQLIAHSNTQRRTKDLDSGRIGLDSPLFSKDRERCFHLGEKFLYHEEGLMNAHFATIMALTEQTDDAELSRSLYLK